MVIVPALADDYQTSIAISDVYSLDHGTFRQTGFTDSLP